MAGGQERILRRRIRSVQSTKKITRAMELIAASRIVKAQARVQAAQPYADGITEVVRDLQAAGAGANNPLLVPREETRRVGEVVLAADRGLCGAYNTTVIRAGRDTTSARSGRRAARPRSSPRAASPRATSGSATTRSTPRWAGSRRTRRYEDARAIAAAVVKPFQDGELDLVQLTYTRFISAGRQVVVTEPLLPLPRVEGEAARAGGGARRAAGRLRVRARARGHPRRAAARATPSRASTPRCSTRRRRSTRPASAR